MKKLIYILLFALIIISYYITNNIEYAYKIVNKKCDSYITHNYSLYCTLSQSGFSDIYIRNYFFTSLQKVYNPKQDKDSIIIDIGSNKGDVSLLFYKLLPLNIIYSVEPLFNNFNYQRKLFKNISQVKLYNYGISSYNEIAKIYTGTNIGYMYVKGEKKSKNKIEQNVNFISMDYFYQKFGIITFIL